MTIHDLATPCFIFDEEEFRRSVCGFQDALRLTVGESIVGYSVKTNSLPYALSFAKSLGCYAEVVSYDEYQLALTCGYEPAQIIYNGPMKSKETFLDAIQGGAVVNIETKREIEWLKELPVNGMYPIGIRLNINITRISPDDADGEDDFSRFGFSDETTEFAEAIAAIQAISQVYLTGLHIHRTTHSRSINFYCRSIAYAANVSKKYSLDLSYLDVGGGYFGIFPNKPTYMDYSKAISETCRENGLGHVKIIVEPGNALHASPFAFLSEVIDVKQIENGLYNVATDGSRNDIDPFFHKKGYLFELIRKMEKTSIVRHQIISGCTCLEYDQLMELKDEYLLHVGDRIKYNNVGAYTMCLTPMFIRYIPRVYACKEGKYKLVRQEWTANEYVIKNLIYK